MPLPREAMELVIGQGHAVRMARLAAAQRRCLFLVGEPGTGKSLIGRAMAELLPARESDLVTVALPRVLDAMRPEVATLTAAAYAQRVKEGAMHTEAQGRTRWMLGVLGSIGMLAVGYVGARQWGAVREFVGLCTAVGIFAGLWLVMRPRPLARPASHQPRVLIRQGKEAPFVDATGLKSGALFGDVRHDPYQSGGHETAPHHLIEPGAIHRAHGGILYIDEIGTLSIDDQRLLLTALQDKALPIAGRSGHSSGCLVQTDPVPCDFIFVAAGHEDDLEGILPALRSRMRGMGYEVKMQVSMPSGEREKAELTRFIAQEVARDGRIGHFAASGVAALLAAAAAMTDDDGQLTLRLRDLGGLVRLAGDLAKAEGAALVTAEHVDSARAVMPWPSRAAKECDSMHASMGGWS